MINISVTVDPSSATLGSPRKKEKEQKIRKSMI